MYKGFFGLDSRKTIFMILGDATARLPVDEFKRIDPAEEMNVCRIVIDYTTFRAVMNEALLAAFGHDTMKRLYKRLIFMPAREGFVVSASACLAPTVGGSS